jgi:AcrR family transcriptional regulator
VRVTKPGTTRDHITETALDLFNTRGVSAVTTNEIAAVAGISPGNLYYYFANKQAIVRALLPRIETAIAACFDYDEDAPLGPARMVKDYVDGIALLWDYRFFFTAFNDLVRSDAEVAEFYAHIEDWSHQAMTDFYAKLVRDGHMHMPGPRTRLSDLARKTLIIWFGMLAMLEARRGPEEMTRADIVDGGLLCFLDVEPYLDADFAAPVRRKLETMRRAAQDVPVSLYKTGT